MKVFALRNWMHSALPIGLLIATTFAVTGCGQRGVKTHPVQGRLEAPGGDLQLLAGHTLEVTLEEDPNVRAAGQIQPDGSFELQTVHSGAVLAGAVPGSYRARIVLGDDDPVQKRTAAKSLPARYLQFEKSGLALEVPAEKEVSLKILRR